MQSTKNDVRKNNQIQLGHSTRVEVERLLPMGLLVKLANGGTGRIREREIGWPTKQGNQDWREQFNQGDKLDAIVISHEQDIVELSLRLVENDPWQDITERYKPDQLIKGIVTGVETYGAFVELEPGVVGLLHHSEIPAVAHGEVGEKFWAGDEVCVSIKEVSVGKRQIKLSMWSNRERRWEGLNLVAEKSLSIKRIQNKDKRIGVPYTEPLLPTRSYFILVIEDEVEQRTAIVQWLDGYGHYVVGIETAEECIDLVRENQPDIIFSDIGLPGKNGMDAAEEILDNYPKIHYVLMTDWTRGFNDGEQLEALRRRGVYFLIKPLLPDDLYLIFEKIKHEISITDDVSSSFPLDAEDDAADNPLFSNARGQRTDSRHNQDLRRLIRTAQRIAGANKVILFRFDKSQRQIFSEMEIGTIRLNRPAIRDLMRSPVREAAEEGRHVMIDSIETREKYAQYLTPLLSFSSCIGIPLHDDLPEPHALFFFFSKPSVLSSEMRDYLSMTSKSVKLTLQNRYLHNQLNQAQQTALVGTLAKGFAHEVNHHLTPVNFAVASLQNKCKAIGGILSAEPHVAVDAIDDAARTLEHLGTGIQNLTKTARAFGHMALQDSERVIRIDQVVEESIDLVNELLDDESMAQQTKINFYAPEQIMYTRAKATQIRQVVVNVILNAVQQIDLANPDSSGSVHVGLDLKLVEAQNYIVIWIEDDGPGIHRRMWGKIFDLGYSNRDGEGSGMGLYISKSLMEEIGGSIQVESSCISWGTCMAVEVPVYIS